MDDSIKEQPNKTRIHKKNLRYKRDEKRERILPLNRKVPEVPMESLALKYKKASRNPHPAVKVSDHIIEP